MPRIAKRWLSALLLVALACDPAPPPTSEVIFSPQPPATSHNHRIAELIAGAQESIDVAIYSFADAEIEAALAAAAARGVEVRFIYQDAGADQKLAPYPRAQSLSGRLEAAGIDVRYVNKIMHHKLMIVDGPRDDLERAATAIIVDGSGNWTDPAATQYDENTLFLRGYVEIALRLQGEFNLLWEHSRDFVSAEDLPFVASGVEISEADIVDTPDTDALFTSANFDITGDTTFTATERSTVSDALIAAIAGATESIRIASGHLRHRGIAEALMAKAQESPELDIRVYLDAQEYVGADISAKQVKDFKKCLAAAGTDESAREDCRDRGYKFGYIVEKAGVDVRYKWYSNRWSILFALQMHHKYLIIDGDELWTGSFNLSNNAEHNTFENMLLFAGPEHADLIDAYVANFERLWTTGREEGLLEQLREEIETAELIPLLFEPMALEWEEVRDLRALIQASCSQAPIEPCAPPTHSRRAAEHGGTIYCCRRSRPAESDERRPAPRPARPALTRYVPCFSERCEERQ